MFVSNCPTTRCNTSDCIGECIPQVKSDIASKLGLTPFVLNVTLANGTNLSGLTQFCSFDGIVSGKRDKLRQIYLSRENNYTKYECHGATQMLKEDSFFFFFLSFILVVALTYPSLIFDLQHRHLLLNTGY